MAEYYSDMGMPYLKKSVNGHCVVSTFGLL